MFTSLARGATPVNTCQLTQLTIRGQRRGDGRADDAGPQGMSASVRPQMEILASLARRTLDEREIGGERKMTGGAYGTDLCSASGAALLAVDSS